MVSKETVVTCVMCLYVQNHKLCGGHFSLQYLDNFITQ